MKVEVDGHFNFQRVTIDPSAVDPGDIELLEDLVLAALRDATGQVQASQQSALDQMCECDDIGAAMLFLCSDLARKITGQTLVVDAGATTKFPFDIS